MRKTLQTELPLTQPTPTSAHRFHLLDALRGLAAMVVVARHSPVSLTALLPTYNSFLAVDFFFGLSGFVIAYSYEGRLRGKLTLRDFTVARVIRLYPMAILGTLLGLAFTLLRSQVWSQLPHFQLLLVTLTSLSILPNVFVPGLGSDMLPFDNPAWSLFFEMVANVSYAALLRCRRSQISVMMAIPIISLIALLVLSRRSNLDGGVSFGTSAIGLARVGFSFFVGVLLFRLRRHLSPRAFRGSSGIAAALLLATTLIAVISVSTPLTRSIWFEFFAVVVLFPITVYQGSRVELPALWTGLCAFLGDISYPLYILHAPLLRPLFNTAVINYANAHMLFRLFSLPVYILALILLTWLLGRYCDLPVRRWLTSRYKRLFVQPAVLLKQ
jgi:peptidoglycan/LPS O-acetylase OafA/YrhL